MSGVDNGMEIEEKIEAEMTTVTERDEGKSIEEGKTKLPLWKLFATKLPAEMRMKIHGYVFVVGKLFPYQKHSSLPYDEDHKKYEVPEMGWMAALALMDKKLLDEGTQPKTLRTSNRHQMTTLKTEAEAVLFGENTLVMNAGNYFEFFTVPDGLRNRHRHRYVESIQIDVWDCLEEEFYREVVNDINSEDLPSAAERLEAIHWQARDLLVDHIWEEAFAVLGALPRLRYLEVRLDKAACHHGCCRLAVVLVKECLRFEVLKNIEEVVLSGMRDEEEKDTLQEIMRTRMQPCTRVTVAYAL